MSARGFAGWLTKGWAGCLMEAWLVRDGAGEAGAYCVLALPVLENQHTVEVNPTVRPSWRGAGVGTALLAHAADRARQEGRTLLTGATDELAADKISPGRAFAQAFGARHRQTGYYRRLGLDSVPAGRMTALRERAEAAARGYSLLTWDGPTPDRWLDDVAALFNAEADAPRAPGEEPEDWDAARVRADEARLAAEGLRWYAVAARPESGAGPVAFTQLCVDPAWPEWGFQELTAVLRPHRGHRLGLLVKLAMLDLMAEREPQLSQILTHNADGNEHMVAINAELGFEVVQLTMAWELEAARVLARTA
jgi:GNAT superfamily N-acetyltransferase